MAFREDNIDKPFYIPELLSEFIRDDHPCFLVKKIVDRVDFSGWEDEHWDTPGMPAFHPRILLRATIQGYVDGIQSGRELARRCETDIVYIYLLGGERPGFRTINIFYKNHADLISRVQYELIEYSKKIDMVNIRSIAVDSTKIKANASSFNVADEKQLKVIRETIEEVIIKNEEEDELLGDEPGDSVSIDVNDEEEFMKYYKEVIEEADDKLGDEKLKFPAKKQLKNAIKNPEKTLDKIKESETALKNSNQNTINLTDNDCVWAPNKKGLMEMGFSVHNIVDMDSGLILFTQVSRNPSDHHDLIPQFEHYESIYGKIGSEISIVADNGYYTEENLNLALENDWDLYIPNKKLATLFKKDLDEIAPFSKYQFTPNDDFTEYICPNNQILTKHETKITPNGTKTFYYADTYLTCVNCPNYKECCKSSTQKIITEYGGNPAKDMYKKMICAHGKEVYKPRMYRAEPPFGH